MRGNSSDRRSSSRCPGGPWWSTSACTGVFAWTGPSCGSLLRTGGAVTSVIGLLPTSIEVDTDPALDVDGAISASEQIIGASISADAVHSELVVFDAGLRDGEPSRAGLAWRLEISSPTPTVHYIDARRGTLISSAASIHTARQRSVRDALRLTEFDEIEANAIEAYDETSMTTPMPPPDAAEAWAASGLVYDYYLDRFGRASWDGGDAPVVAYVDYGNQSEQARQLDGAMYFDRGMVTAETVAHEFSHAVINAETNLPYAGYTGSIQEAFADVFAHYVEGAGEPWSVGDGTAAGIVRDPSNPVDHGGVEHFTGTKGLEYGEACSGDVAGECGPATCTNHDLSCIAGCTAPMACEYGLCRQVADFCANDNGHIHDNSTVLSYAAYEITDAGISVGSKKVAGIGATKAEQIFYRALDLYVGSAQRFLDFRDAAVAACHDFAFDFPEQGLPNHGITGQDCGVVINAFVDVGVSAEIDRDVDGWEDRLDNCPDDPNSDQLDTNDNDVGDACEGDGGDGDGDISFTVCEWSDRRSADEHTECSWEMPDGCDLAGGSQVQVSGDASFPTLTTLRSGVFTHIDVTRLESVVFWPQYGRESTEPLPDSIVYGDANVPNTTPSEGYASDPDPFEDYDVYSISFSTDPFGADPQWAGVTIVVGPGYSTSDCDLAKH